MASKKPGDAKKEDQNPDSGNCAQCTKSAHANTIIFH